VRRLRLIHRGGASPEELSVELDGARCVLRRGGEILRGEVARLPDGRVSLVLEDGRQTAGRILAAGPGEVALVRKGVTRRIALAEPLQDRLVHAAVGGAGSGRDEEVRALMPGRVVEVAVAVGTRVPSGHLLLVLEAMKMQNEIRSSRAGIVSKVEVGSGVAVDRGALLVVLSPDPEAAQIIQ
jgi:biotin carboxyl carrier protein